MMDPAVLRPGRFGKLLYVPLPSPDERGLILRALGRKKPIDASVDLSAIGKMDGCENLSGADLAALVGLCWIDLFSYDVEADISHCVYECFLNFY